MATTGLYQRSVGDYGKGDIDLVNDRIVAALLDVTNYTVNLTTDEFLSDLPANTVVASVVLTGKSVTGRLDFDADDTTFPDVATATKVQAALLYRDTGFENSSQLIYYDDDATGLPITGDGDDVVITWPDPIFKMGS